MDVAILVAIISLFSSIIVAIVVHFLNKKKEMENYWKERKLQHYKELLTAISDLAIDDKDKTEANVRFAEASNTICLVADQNVISALMAFHDYAKSLSREGGIDKHDMLLKDLLLEIRRDIGVSKKDDKETFSYHLVGARPRT